MSKPYKRTGAGTWSYDFQWQGRRFSGNTECTSKRDAEKWIAHYKTQIKAATTVHRHGEDLSVRDAVARYLDEVSKYKSEKEHDAADRDFAWLAAELKSSRMLSSITNADVSKLIAKRRKQGLANSSVNRYVIERLRALMLAARDEWAVPVQPINWKRLRLKERPIRIREMTADEEDLVIASITARYIPVIHFAVLSGFRLEEAVNLRWPDIDWRNGFILMTGKGDKDAIFPLSDPIRKLLWPLPRTSETVFGVTYSGVKSAWRRCREKTGIRDLKFHDLRHTFATRLRRSGADLALVKDALRHSDISTTMRYAHVTMTDLKNAMDAANPTGSPTENPTQARKASDK